MIRRQDIIDAMLVREQSGRLAHLTVNQDLLRYQTPWPNQVLESTPTACISFQLPAPTCVRCGMCAHPPLHPQTFPSLIVCTFPPSPPCDAPHLFVSAATPGPGPDQVLEGHTPHPRRPQDCTGALRQGRDAEDARGGYYLSTLAAVARRHAAQAAIS